jgi:hypothetical protein
LGLAREAVRSVLSPAEWSRLEQILGGSPRDQRAVENARGVCLMRLGRNEEAVAVFRGLALSGLFLRADVPVIFAVNLATALLVEQNLDGCCRILDELERRGESCPASIKVRAAIAAWKKGMSWTERLKGVLGVRKPILLDYSPGDLG